MVGKFVVGNVLYSEVFLVFKFLDVLVVFFYIESCSFFILEGMVMVKFIVVSNVGGNFEFVNYGENGFFFEMGNVEDFVVKMSFVVEDGDVWMYLSCVVRWFVVNEYLIDVMVKCILLVYECVMCFVELKVL